MNLRWLILPIMIGICKFSTAEDQAAPPPPSPPMIPSSQAQVPNVQQPQLPNTQDLTNMVNYGAEISSANERVAEQIRTANAHQIFAAAAIQPIALVPASAELRAVAASPSPSERLRQLRQQAQEQLNEIRNLGWQLSFAGLTTILSLDPGGDPGPEGMFREARRLCGEYLETQAEIESITHDREKAEKRKEQYLANLVILRQGNYAVNVSNSTTTTPPNQWSRQPEPDHGTSGKRCHMENRTEMRKVHMAIGSDGYGNKIYSDEDDPYLQPYLVCE